MTCLLAFLAFETFLGVLMLATVTSPCAEDL